MLYQSAKQPQTKYLWVQSIQKDIWQAVHAGDRESRADD